MLTADEPRNGGQPATQAQAAPAGAPLKFAFASGAKPLAGYTIKRGVGRGGFGEVYYAVSDAGKEVALKLIRRNLDVELRGVTHCLNLKHPNLVALYDIKQDDQDNSWVVMEFVSGESLEQAIQRQPGGMPADEALQWMQGIAAGVAYLHDHGIVHRDLKPGNIFLDEGVVKLGDYGLSKFISCSRRSGQTESVGTVHYMAPEIANGRYGKEIDLYALGVILYEMLTGRLPFEGESVGEVLMKHLTAQPDLSPLAEPYRTIIARALAKDPDSRFRSVPEFMAQLPVAPAVGSAFAKYPQVRLAADLGGGAGARQAGDPAHGAAANGAPRLGMPAPSDPVSTAAHEIWDSVRRFWRRSNTLTKVALIVVAVVVLGDLRGDVTPGTSLIFMVAAIYVAYTVIRAALAHHGAGEAVAAGAAGRPFGAAAPRPVPADLPTLEVATPPRVEPVQRPTPERAFSSQPMLLPARTPRERAAELTGSLLLSALVSAAMALVSVLLRGEPPRPEQYTWLFLASTVGAWAVLVPSKFWERDSGEVALRRFAMLLVGLAFGVCAYLIKQALVVELPFEIAQGMPRAHLFGRSFYDASGDPLPYTYMAYFGFLFLLMRWWLQAEPLRPARVSLWSTICTVVVAGMLNLVWPFPQPWGVMVAATISIAVQLSSPWLPPQKRLRRRMA